MFSSWYEIYPCHCYRKKRGSYHLQKTKTVLRLTTYLTLVSELRPFLNGKIIDFFFFMILLTFSLHSINISFTFRKFPFCLVIDLFCIILMLSIFWQMFYIRAFELVIVYILDLILLWPFLSTVYLTSSNYLSPLHASLLFKTNNRNCVRGKKIQCTSFEYINLLTIVLLNLEFWKIKHDLIDCKREMVIVSQ